MIKNLCFSKKLEKKTNPKVHRNTYYTFVLRETDQNGQLFPKSYEHVNLVACRPL